MIRARGAWAAIAFGTSGAACSLVVSTSGLTGRAPDAIEAGVDAAPGQDAASDAIGNADAPRACDLAKSFSAPVKLPDPINTSSAETSGVLTDDGLTFYFSSTRNGSKDLFVATRPNVAGAWGGVTPLASINSAQDDTNVYVSADQLTIAFDSDRPASVAAGNLYLATRAKISDPFGAPSLLDTLSTPSEDIEPWLSAAGDRIYWASNRGGASLDLYTAARSGGTFSAPVALSELNSASDEESPIVSRDELTVFFSSARPGGKGGADIYVATRADRAARFGAPVLVPELNSSAQDFPTWVSSDGCRVIIQSFVGGNSDLYLAERGK